MRFSNALGWVIIFIIAATLMWLAIVSPSYENYLLMQARSLRPLLTCKWTAPWNDPSFWLIGWSSPQSGTLWSNARRAHIVFRLPAASANREVQVGIRYAALTADAEVRINGVDAGHLNKTTHVFNYLLKSSPSYGVIDVQLSISNVPRRWYDGRYAGVLLTTVRACVSRI